MVLIGNGKILEAGGYETRTGASQAARMSLACFANFAIASTGERSPSQ
jgi:hypothetical protein